MLKQHIIKHYLDSEEIIAIVPQHHGKALGLMLKYVAFGVVLFVVYRVIGQFVSYTDLMSVITAIALAALLLMFTYHFMMIYLDSVVITNQGVTIMDQVGLLDFNQTRFDRDSIQTISQQQHGMGDRLLNKGDIVIGIEHETAYTLPNVVQASKRVDRLNHYKHESIVERARQIALAQEDVIQTPQYDKFELLVDKLSDIIVDYMKQPRSADIIDGDNESTEAEDDYPELYNTEPKE